MEVAGNTLVVVIIESEKIEVELVQEIEEAEEIEEEGLLEERVREIFKEMILGERLVQTQERDSRKEEKKVRKVQEKKVKDIVEKQEQIDREEELAIILILSNAA